MFNDLKKIVFNANMFLKENNLVILTWGNVSLITPDRKYVIIKPSGVSYNDMKAEDMVVVDLEHNVVEGKLKPSSDTWTHINIYKGFPNINSIVHTHSPFATSWAQACSNIKTFGTTHADTFYGDIMCTRSLTSKEIETDYEKHTGDVIVKTFKGKDYLACPAILVANHGPFIWGTNPMKAVENALILEEVAKMATLTQINSGMNPKEAPKFLQDKHYNRKHGKNAYYGQK